LCFLGVDMSPELLVSVGAAAVALVVGYVPQVKAKYDKLDGAGKRAVMGGAILGVTLAAGLASCVPAVGSVVPPTWLVPCDEKSLGELVRLAFYGLAANQGTYLLAVRPAPTEE